METSTTSFFTSPPQATPVEVDAFSLGLLSGQLERLLDPAFLDRADAEIVLAAGGGEPGSPVVGGHSCILAARSSFFLHRISSLPAGEKPRLELAEVVPGGCHIGREALVAVLGYLYTGRFKVPPQECVDDACRHAACRPAIDFVVESTYAASGFQISELVSLCQRCLTDFVNIAVDEDVIPIIHVASTCQLSDLLRQCIQRVAISTLDNKYLEKELPGDIYSNIKELRHCSFPDESDDCMSGPEHEDAVRNIHEALDSNDIDLVARLLKESTVTLDDAFAIHYAAAYCEHKVLAELLKLDSPKVNLKNNNGYTPLHMACMRLEPSIILSLVDKGASVLERTPDGRDALTICKRLTRQKDNNTESKKGQERSNAYLCINILEQTKRNFILNVVALEEKIFTPLLADDLLISLLDLEYRVAFAKLFYPSEAQLAMLIAEADLTEKFDVTKLKEVGLDETPTMHGRLCERLDALTKTVDLGRRCFPNCSEVLDKFLDKESADLALLGNGTPEDQLIKRMQFYEVKKDVQVAFDKDKAASAVIASTASSPSSPRSEMLTPSTSPSQTAGATDSAHVLALPPGPSRQVPNGSTAFSQLESEGTNVVVHVTGGVGSKRKLKSTVWDEFRRVKIGDDWKAKCMWCHKRLSACTKNGTTHLRNHLNICRPRQATKGLKQSNLKLSHNPHDNTNSLEKYVFDEEVARKELALMICSHEYPLSMVDHAGFRKFCAVLQPMFKVVSRNAIRKDILDMYEVQKHSMVKYFQQYQARVAVTTDMWTTYNQKKNYMAVTAHYIDDSWKLKSYLLRFIYVPAPHSGEVISDVVHEVIMDWHIERKLSTVSLDNCTTSDNLKEKMLNKLHHDSLVLDNSLLHMRYAVYILNLIVKEGMTVVEKGIERVRESVAFWVATQKRQIFFEKVASKLSFEYRKRITLDCKATWTSTYVMLSIALD